MDDDARGVEKGARPATARAPVRLCDPSFAGVAFVAVVFASFRSGGLWRTYLAGDALAGRCAVAFGVGLALAGAALVVCVMVGARRGLVLLAWAPLPLLPAGCALACLASPQVGILPSGWLPIAYVLVAVGCVLGLAACLERCAARGFAPLVVSASCAVLLGGVVRALGSALPFEARAGLVVASGVVAAVLCPPVRAGRAAAPSPALPRKGEATLAAALRLSGDAAFAGLALCLLTWGVMSVPPAEALASNAFAYVGGEVLGVLVALLLARAMGREPDPLVARQKASFLLPVFAAFVAYFAFVRVLGAAGALKFVLSVGYNMAVVGLFSLAAASLAHAARSRSYPVALTVGPAAVLCAAAYLLGFLLYSLLGNAAMYVQLVLSTAYLAGICVASMYATTVDDERRISRRVDDLSREFRLSARESEVLGLIARDYPLSRIAEELSVSPETVKVYRKRIYQKADVHAADELMHLVRRYRR